MTVIKSIILPLLLGCLFLAPTSATCHLRKSALEHLYIILHTLINSDFKPTQPSQGQGYSAIPSDPSICSRMRATSGVTSRPLGADFVFDFGSGASVAVTSTRPYSYHHITQLCMTLTREENKQLVCTQHILVPV